MRVTTGRRDAGFTLIELLTAMVITGVVVAALANAVIGVVRNTAAVDDRLALSHDAQISAAYFARDVASVGTRDRTASGAPLLASIQPGAAYDAGGQVCGTTSTPAALVRFLADDWYPDATVRVDVVAYYLTAPVAGVSELHRMKCVGSPAPVSDAVLAHYVNPATAGVTCSGTCTAAGTGLPQAVTLAFTVTKRAADPYPITLTGQRRQS